ncbi:MAG: 5-oxoprolinase subunit PxpB [Gemmatimonadales bacterium]
MSDPPPVLPISPLGESAWTVILGVRVDPEINHAVRQLARWVASAHLPGVIEIVPAYAALTVFFDPHVADPIAIREALVRLEDAQTPVIHDRQPDRPPVIIPVRYDGPDLDEVAERTGLTRDEVTRRHAAPIYRVYCLGFVPGWAYLGDLDPALHLPRRDAPRTRVPAGAVAIAGSQTGVYPFATPGGWHLLGRTETVMFDPQRDPPALLGPDYRVQFDPVS